MSPVQVTSPDAARRFLGHLFGHFRKHRRTIAFALLCMVVHSLSRQVPILATGLLVDNVIVEPSADLSPQAARDLRLHWLTMICVGVMLAAAVGALAYYACEYFFKWLATRVVVDIRAEVMRHLLHVPVKFFGKRKMGDLNSRLTNDVQATFMTVNLFLSELIQEPITIIAAFVPAFGASWQLSLFLVPLVPLVVFPVLRQARRIRKRSRKGFEALGETTEVMMQSLAGIRIVKAFRAEEGEYERFVRYNEEFLHRSLRVVRTKAFGRGSMDFIYNASIALFILAGGLLFVNGAWGLDRPGDFVMFLGAMAAMYRPVRRLAQGYSNFQESLAAAGRLYEVLDVPLERDDGVAAGSWSGWHEEIRLDDVTFAHESAAGPALQGVSFKIRRGQTVALVGRSGAGKSTTADLLARFNRPASGRILVDGVPLETIARGAWLDRVAVVSQHPFVFNTTVRENILYGRPKASADEVVAAARAANIHDVIMALPQGYDTAVGDRGQTLSGGELQRLTIARAILRDADLLILDEATSSLDTHSERLVHEALERLMRGRTSLVIAHRLSTVMRADLIVVLERGRVVESGRHQELLAAGGPYARLHALQLGGDPVAEDSEPDA